MALTQRFTNTGILQTVGNIVEDSLNIEPTVVTSTSITPHAIAEYPNTITGTVSTSTNISNINDRVRSSKISRGLGIKAAKQTISISTILILK